MHVLCIISCNARKREVTIWKRPVLTKGPLGIVSGTELAFFLIWEERLDSVAVILGEVGNWAAFNQPSEVIVKVKIPHELSLLRLRSHMATTSLVAVTDHEPTILSVL
ncbi:hypothetical protein VNO78_25691 [Psophocarpus tetragonolobus]|uniref:Uncharacterized protein n=1 Tax=Psophocarpus tetragonolobus TaxID=3891 RepID=A0AAN9S887_PSOTE